MIKIAIAIIFEDFNIETLIRKNPPPVNYGDPILINSKWLYEDFVCPAQLDELDLVRVAHTQVMPRVGKPDMFSRSLKRLVFPEILEPPRLDNV
jgi:hypothetical protein